MTNKIAVISFIAVFVHSAIQLTAGAANEARSGAIDPSNIAVKCNENNKMKTSQASENRDRRRSIEMMRETNRLAFEIVWREMGQRGFVYFVDTSRSLDCVEAELDAEIGDLLEFSVNHHKRKIQNIIAAHKSVHGWPAASFIRLVDDAEYNICIISPYSHEKSAIEFATGIADVVAGHVDPKDTYSIVSPSRMSTVGIVDLLRVGPLHDYDHILELSRGSTPACLYDSKHWAEQFMTKIFLLSKNAEAAARFPNATIYDADDILAIIGAPRKIMEAVDMSVTRCVSMLDCRRAQLSSTIRRAVALACRQIDGNFIFATDAVLSLEPLTGDGRSINQADAAIISELTAEIAEASFTNGQHVSFPSHALYHQLQYSKRSN